MNIDLTVQETHHTGLCELSRAGINTAYVLCGRSDIGFDPWDRVARVRLTTFKIVPQEVLEKEGRAAQVQQLAALAKSEQLVLGIVYLQGAQDKVHTIPEQHEGDIVEALESARCAHPSLLVVSLNPISLTLTAKLRLSADQAIDLMRIQIIGQRLLFNSQIQNLQDLGIWSRQTSIFGLEATQTIRNLKIGIVGCGGTGSATAILLARLGVGQLVLFDDDIVDTTNLNRLHGSRRADADAMRLKVDVLFREITELGIGTRVVVMHGWVGNRENRDALRSCDVVFGCTDDHDGRLLLNRFAYFYLIPVIDMGLAIEPSPSGGMLDMTGRVTVLAPKAPCLLCRNIIDPIKARDESLKRSNPTEFQRRKHEAYVIGGDNPAPAVVTMTTATACMAVDELVAGITDFRQNGGFTWNQTRRFDQRQDHRPGAKRDLHCSVCGEEHYWGRADVEPFLDRTG